MNFQIDKTQKWVLDAVLRRIQQMPDFESLVRLRLEEARRNDNLSEQKEALQKRCLRLRNEASNFTEAIRVGGNLRSLVAELEASQLELAHCEFQLQQLEKQQCSAVPIPAHGDLVGLIEKAMQLVVDQNDETNRLLCRILPRVTIFPVLLCNGGAVKLQAEVELDVSAAMGALTGSSAMVDDLREIVTADLFDTPAYVRYAETFGAAESRNEKVIELAERLGVSLAHGDVGASALSTDVRVRRDESLSTNRVSARERLALPSAQTPSVSIRSLSSTGGRIRRRVMRSCFIQFNSPTSFAPERGRFHFGREMIDETADKARSQATADWKRFWSIVFAVALRAIEEETPRTRRDEQRDKSSLEERSKPNAAD